MTATLVPAEPIAIVGIGCRFPGADGVEAFWRLLVNGVDAITEVPRSRFDIDEYFDPMPGRPGKIASRFGGFVGDLTRFDAAFFGIAPRDAEAMDPQHRILLELTYEALEDAGLPPDRPGLSATGVFGAMIASDYLHHVYRRAEDLDLAVATGSARSAATARISHAFGFEGPSVAVDADRASSLVALHLACRSLRSGECAVAIVAAANAVVDPEPSIACSRSRMLAPDGRCKFCDARADGIVRSDGFGVLVLKRLRNAMADGDRVYASVRGTAVTNNGRLSDDILRPSPEAQEALLRAALKDADVHPHQISYVEAHGTGTRIGDAVEIEALGNVFGRARASASPCAIGSVKTNIGHAEAAAGIAGAIKVALALWHGRIPASLHNQRPRPELALESRRLRVQTETTPWPAGEGPRLAGVTAIGLTGTLAHAILEAPPFGDIAEASSADEPRAIVLPLSARSPEALDDLAAAYREWLNQSDLFSPARIGCSAAIRRQHHPYRLAIVGSSRHELVTDLDAHLDGREPYVGARGHATAARSKLAFVFPGQGGQWAGMGRELFASEPVFRDAIDRCDRAIRREAGWSAAALLLGRADTRLLDEIDYVQPVLTAVMIALAALWRSWGVEPDVVVGFSMGEAAAAHVAGILSLEDAVAVVCRRTRLMKQRRGAGAIASVPLSYADAMSALDPYASRLSVAVVSSPETTVISGDRSAMEEFIADLQRRGLSCRQVNADVASHSAQMDGLLGDLRAALADVRPRAGSIPLLSTVDEAYVHGPELDCAYWPRNLRQPVRQMDAILRLLRDGIGVFLEVSPHPIAWGPIVETIRHAGTRAQAVASLRRGEAERQALLRSVGALYASGIGPDWTALFDAEDRRFVPLPAYVWQRRSFWFGGTEPPRSSDRIPAHVAAPAPRGRRRLADDLRAAPPAQRAELLRTRLQSEVGRLLKMAPAAIGRRAPLRELGLTSLMAAELALTLRDALGRPCPATLLFSYPTIDQLSEHLLAQDLDDVSQAIPDWTEPPTLPERRDAHAAPIAIVGVACRFPGGASSPDEYWRLLRSGADAITEVPADRWDADRFYDPDPDVPGKMYTRWGGFLDGIDQFDASYFGISPREAEVMDPQQRLLLEVAVEALENAAVAPDPRRRLDAGVFVGIMNNNDFVSLKGTPSDPARLQAHDSTGHATSAAAGRLSYALGFSGPSIAVDTACSSSLVAVHLACQALRAGECAVALAGGVNVILAPEVTIAFCKTRMLSPTGRCRTFDARADGYVRAEGCGLVVLKRLSDALRAGDRILAVIRGSAVNQDGRSSSLTAPNGLAQQDVIRRALAAGGVRPADVDYVEAHGTGTALGDPIEIEALGHVLAEERDPQRPLAVGSVKTNVGHLESAAGVAGLIKIVLSLEHEEIPPHLHLDTVNPRISLDAAMAIIPTRVTSWPRGGKRRIAGVSSFGFVGTNAHVVIEEAPDPRAETEVARPRPSRRLLALSARSAEGLNEVVRRYRRLVCRESIDVDDVCFTANTGRLHHPVRAAFVGADADALARKLEQFHAGSNSTPIAEGSGGDAPKLGFLFTGQGSQYPGMGRKLFAAEPVFRSAVERCAGVIDPLLRRSVVAVLHDDDPDVLSQTKFAQPALFALEYGLLELWRAWGIEPWMVMGHSLGEYVAAVAAGVLTLDDAAKLVVTRGHLMQSVQAGGGSAAVFASEAVVTPFLARHGDAVAVAADNAPERVLIAGEAAALRVVCQELASHGIEARPMNGLVAAHCALLDPILDAFEAVGAMVDYRPPAIPLVSTRTGRIVTPADVGTARHWRDLMRQTVRFKDGVRSMYQAGCRAFLEIGPRHTLLRLGEMCLLPGAGTWIPSLARERHDHEQILESLAALYVRGVDVRWDEHHRPFAGRPIAVPGTVFERKRFWPALATRPATDERAASAAADARPALVDPLLGRRVASPLSQIQFEARVDVASLPFLKDHLIFDSLVTPAAAHIARVLAAAGQVTGRGQLVLREALFPEPMMLCDEDDARIAHLVLTPNGTDAQYGFEIASVDGAAAGSAETAWRVHAKGRVAVDEDGTPAAFPDPEASVGASMLELSSDEFYARQTRHGYGLGPSFRWVDRVWVNGDEALARLRRPATVAATARGLHPGLLDACFHAATMLADAADDSRAESVLVPAAIEGVRAATDDNAVEDFVYCRISSLPSTAPDAATSTLAIFRRSGEPMLSIAKLQFRRVRRAEWMPSGAARARALRRIEWRPSALAASAQHPAGRWLVIPDDAQTAARVNHELQRRGQQVTLAFQPQDLDRIIADMRAEAGPPWQGTICFCARDSNGAAAKGNSAGGDASGSALIALVHALIAGAAVTEPPPLWLVTRGGQRTGRERELGGAEQAIPWGLGRVLASEHPQMFGGLVDLDPHATDRDDLSDLGEEILGGDGETQVAYRAGRRLVPRLVPLERTRRRIRPSIRPDAAYLITGAFGALGRALAGWLAAQGARHLALVSRRGLDAEREAWIDRFRQRSVHAMGLRADVSNLEELASALDQIDRSMPALAGVIHAAGIVDDRILANLDAAAVACVLAPKTRGSENLDVLTRDRPLDFWVICSSVSAVLGNPGQAAYAAANAYADAVAERRRLHGHPALSINWGPWGGDGMSAAFVEELRRRWGLLPIEPADAVEMLTELLGADVAQAWAAPIDVDVLRGRAAELPHLSIAADLLGGSEPIARPARRRAAAPVRAAADMVADSYAAVLHQVMDVVRSVTAMDPSEEIAADRRFDELGVDSLLTLDLLDALGHAFGASVPGTILIDCPTVERLARYLAAQPARAVPS